MVERIAADVKAKPAAVDIQGFPGGQMGSSRDMIEAVANGTATDHHRRCRQFGAWIPSISVTEAPFIWKNPAHLIKAMNGPLLEKYNEQLVKGARHAHHRRGLLRYRHLTTSDRAVKTVADAKGLKVRVPENDVFKAMAEAAGRQADTDELQRIVSGTEDRHRRRAGKPVADDQVRQVQREVQKYIILTGHAVRAWSRGQ